MVGRYRTNATRDAGPVGKPLDQEIMERDIAGLFVAANSRPAGVGALVGSPDGN
jgi:hypothetical protein